MNKYKTLESAWAFREQTGMCPLCFKPGHADQHSKVLLCKEHDAEWERLRILDDMADIPKARRDLLEFVNQEWGYCAECAGGVGGVDYLCGRCRED